MTNDNLIEEYIEETFDMTQNDDTYVDPINQNMTNDNLADEYFEKSFDFAQNNIASVTTLPLKQINSSSEMLNIRNPEEVKISNNVSNHTSKLDVSLNKSNINAAYREVSASFINYFFSFKTNLS